MAIKAHKGPPAGLAIVQRALAMREHQATTFSTPLGGSPQTGSPVPLYYLSLQQLNDERPLAAARIVSWQYPVVGGLHPGLAEYREDFGDGGMSQGPLPSRFVQASMLAEQELSDNAEEFEPRLLDVPALQFAALWLHSATDKDFFISLLDGSPAGAAPLKVVRDVVPLLRARAASRAPAMPQLGGGPQNTPTN
jgi:hypothetical protein